MTFTLSGTVYNHDDAAADIFFIAVQPGVRNYQNALRGFRHGVDKIDLHQTGITDFSQLSITRKNRGTLNGLSIIHGVDVTFKGANGRIRMSDCCIWIISKPHSLMLLISCSRSTRPTLCCRSIRSCTRRT